VAELSIHPIMSVERNTVVLRNAALGALVVLAIFECNGFIAVRFGINGVFCKQNRSNTPRNTARVPVHGPYTAVYMSVETGCVHDRVYGP